jgi:hypothetical protein
VRRSRLLHKASPLARLGIAGLVTTMTAVLPLVVSAGPAAAADPINPSVQVEEFFDMSNYFRRKLTIRGIVGTILSLITLVAAIVLPTSRGPLLWLLIVLPGAVGVTILALEWRRNENRS